MSALRRLGVPVLLAAATVAGPLGAGPASAAGCTWRIAGVLQAPDGSIAHVSGTDGGDRFVGTVTDRNAAPGDQTTDRAAVWRAGVLTVLPAPVGSGAGGYGVNRSGDVVGVVYTPNQPDRAALWHQGVLTLLAAPAGRPATQARDVNDAGLIVGSAHGGLDTDGPVRWSVDDPATVADVPAPQGSWVAAVTSDGTIVGDWLDQTTLTGHAIAGTVAGLRPVAEPTGASGTSAAAAAGRYAVGRTAFPGRMDGQATRWTDGRPELLATTDTQAFAVNSAGVVAGLTWEPALRPVVWQAGRQRTLPVAAVGGDSGSAEVITEGNVVAGNVNRADGTSVQVTWRCR